MKKEDAPTPVGQGFITNLIADTCAQLDILHKQNEEMRKFVFSIDSIGEGATNKELELPLYKNNVSHLQNLAAIHDAIVYEVNVQANIAVKLNELFKSDNINISL